MKRVYLLLRNNIESGPYTIEELLKQKLRPADLVWIEGQSQAWSYPSELDELKKFVPPVRKPSINPKRAAATYFSDEIEQKAEDLRKKVMSFVPKYYSYTISGASESINNNLRNIEKEEIKFTDHRKKELALYEMFSAVVVTLFVAVSVYGGYSLFITKTMTPAVVASKNISVDSHAAKAATKPVRRPALVAADTALSQLAPDTSLHQAMDSAEALKPVPKKVVKKDTTLKKHLPLLALDSSKSEEVLAQSNTQPPPEETMKKDTVQSESKDSVATEPEKKRSLGQVLKGLFKKKKKPEKAAEQQDTTGQGVHQ